MLRVYRALQDTTGRLREVKANVRRMQEQVRAAKTQLRELRTGVQDTRRLATRRERDVELLTGPAVDQERLQAVARKQGRAYRSAQPFPHIVLDDLVDPALLDRVLEEFEAMDRGTWHQTDKDRERKWSTEDVRQLGPFTWALIARLNAGPFLTCLEELTGIAGLLSDPHLRGGGLHEIRGGLFLGVHADFNVHKRLKVYRRLNLLIYLNKNWDPAWGGSLELWDNGGQACVRQIEPVFNRAVLFDTSNFSYHGHPDPVMCPPERSRKSLALYYYSVEYPFEEDRAAHGTVFLDTDAAHKG